MKLGEIVEQLEIDPRKLMNYALNPDNPVGSNKAILFRERLGFTQENYELLLAQIMAQALEAEAVMRQLDEHGQRYQVDLAIIGVEEQREIVRTGWIVKPGSDVARLVTLYVRR